MQDGGTPPALDVYVFVAVHVMVVPVGKYPGKQANVQSLGTVQSTSHVDAMRSMLAMPTNNLHVCPGIGIQD